jgi:hypothetical protein
LPESSRLRVKVAAAARPSWLSLLRGVLLGLFLIAVKLFDEMVDLLRIALFNRYFSQILPLLAWIAGHRKPFLLLFPFYSLIGEKP